MTDDEQRGWLHGRIERMKLEPSGKVALCCAGFRWSLDIPLDMAQALDVRVGTMISYQVSHPDAPSEQQTLYQVAIGEHIVYPRPAWFIEYTDD